MNTQTIPAFDTATFRRAIEERDAALLLTLYADDAELQVVDRTAQPTHPQLVRGRQAIGDYFADVCGRDMTHRIERLFSTADHAAFVQLCRYPGGSQVQCAAVLDLRDGKIVRQSGVQAWDEENHLASPAPEHKDFSHPDEIRAFPHGQVELLHIGGSDIGRLVLQPGWRWSSDVKPVAGTDLCEAPHFQYHVAGTLRIELADGTQFDARPGQVTALPSGHDAWVIGDEPVVIVDWWGASNYAKG
jgi:ketosteroid isomerase-like protein